MIIGVDYTAAAWQGAGIGRYTRGLIRAVVAQDQTIHYTLFYAARGLPTTSPYLSELRTLCATYPNVRARPIPLSPRLLTILWQRLRLPLRAEYLVGSLDLLHAPDFVLPPTRARTLLTVHDLTFLVHPECAEAGLRAYLSRAVPRALAQATMVLVDSQATAHDLARLLGVAGPHVRLLYPGVEPQFRPLPPEVTEPIRQQLDLPEHFLLFVGTLEPRKNLVRLIDGFAQADLPASMMLVLAGKPGWLYKDVFSRIEQLGLNQRVRFLDFVADEQLPALYNLAQAFVYPSLYEGFGLPVLEALACGIPVVTANTSSLIEVAGQAAILVDPYNPADIATGIAVALRKAPQLREAGSRQAHNFTWAAAAQTLLNCYVELAT